MKLAEGQLSLKVATFLEYESGTCHFESIYYNAEYLGDDNLLSK